MIGTIPRWAVAASMICHLLTIDARASGTLTNSNEAKLDVALAGGGAVNLLFDGKLTLTSSKTIVVNTIIDGTGHRVTLSGGNKVRLFTVTNGVTLGKGSVAQISRFAFHQPTTAKSAWLLLRAASLSLLTISDAHPSSRHGSQAACPISGSDLPRYESR
jgi:hypothetical protein